MRRTIALLLLAVACLGCKGGPPRAYGAKVDVGSAVPLSRLLSAAPPSAPGPVVVSGRISEVCRSAGCWFTLSDESGGRTYSILVDLKPRASFTVPAGVLGRRAVVSGRFARDGGDPRIDADGLVLR